MINSTRGCVACDDLWPWPISSRSFGLDFENRVRSATFSVVDRLFPYLAQIIISIKGCVTCNDLWPWPIFSRSFGLDFENRVRSVASTVLDGFFPYLVQMITSMRRCVACDDLWPWPISSRSFDLDFENRVWGGGYPRRWHRLIYLVVPGNGLTPNRRQAITYTNDGDDYWWASIRLRIQSVTDHHKSWSLSFS